MEEYVSNFMSKDEIGIDEYSDIHSQFTPITPLLFKTSDEPEITFLWGSLPKPNEINFFLNYLK